MVPLHKAGRGLRQVLLLEEDEDPDDFDDDNDDDETPCIIATGLPRRPMYLELARRLQKYKKNNNDGVVLADAAVLGFAEESPPRLPPPPSSRWNLHSWLEKAGDDGVLRILGLRQTMGTDPRKLLPPSTTKLLEASRARHSANVALSVAARARAKHANRSNDSIFGTVKGNDEQHNTDTATVIETILHEAIWIYIHTFGGLDGKPVLEVRMGSGYGARWTADWSDPVHPTNVQFRGFLEPTMDDGHEKGWKH